MAEQKEMQVQFGKYLLTVQLDDMEALQDLAHSKDNRVLCQLLLQVAELVSSEMRDAVRAGEVAKSACAEGHLSLAENLITLLDDGLQKAFDDHNAEGPQK